MPTAESALKFEDEELYNRKYGELRKEMRDITKDLEALKLDRSRQEKVSATPIPPSS